MPLLLYLVRHAHALDMANDDVRPLSEKGRQQIARLAKFLGPSGAFCPDELWHSPLVRARETAELLLEHLRLEVPRHVHRELESAANPELIADKLSRGGGALALVGHEPHLSCLASLLVTGSTSPTVFSMQKAAVLALEPGLHRWSVRWHISPEIVQ
jgi:phosphohistidine phosphatase